MFTNLHTIHTDIMSTENDDNTNHTTDDNHALPTSPRSSSLEPLQVEKRNDQSTMETVDLETPTEQVVPAVASTDVDFTQDPNFHTIYNVVKGWFSGKEMTQLEISTMYIRIMQLIQNLVSNRGDYKKQFMLFILKKIIQERDDMTEVDKSLLIMFLDTVLPQLIDTSVSLARGELGLGKKRRSRRLCCFCV